VIITQSELNRAGFGGVDFQSLPRERRKQVAALAFRRIGRDSDAFLLEVNNMISVSTLRYVQDAQPVRQ
jgi:hypothetical protein